MLRPQLGDRNSSVGTEDVTIDQLVRTELYACSFCEHTTVFSLGSSIRLLLFCLTETLNYLPNGVKFADKFTVSFQHRHSGIKLSGVIDTTWESR
jgi:hypothetical protein